MGVKGLSSLVKEKQIFEYIHFRDSKLVVDGNNLVYHLYFTSKLDQNHGGEYLAFQAQVRAFFKNLDVCGDKPYVLMDGGSGDNVDRMETVRARNREKFPKAHDAAVTGMSKGILPIQIWLVFEQTLSDMKVPQAKCFGEADRPVAALAKEWSCPVLSNDSDFYIFDLPKGLLLFDHFRWDVMEVDGNGSYIPCRRYTTSLFCNFFHIDANLLTVFASLAQNDSVFFPEDGMSWSANLGYLLSWLQGFQTTEDTLTAAMEMVPERNRHEEQVLYGLLLGQGVTELVRDGLEFTSIMVQPVVPEATMNLTLESLPQTDRAVRLRVFLETMGVEEEWLKGVPDELLLPVAVTCYWLRWARPKPNLKHLEALLMVMVQGELNRRKGVTGGWQGGTYQIPHPPDSGVAHSFNQWQACLQDASLLNQLLCTPLPQPHMAWLYQGRLVHQRVKQLQQAKQRRVHSANFSRMYNIVLGATLFVHQ